MQYSDFYNVQVPVYERVMGLPLRVVVYSGTADTVCEVWVAFYGLTSVCVRAGGALSGHATMDLEHDEWHSTNDSVAVVEVRHYLCLLLRV